MKSVEDHLRGDGLPLIDHLPTSDPWPSIIKKIMPWPIPGADCPSSSDPEPTYKTNDFTAVTLADDINLWV